MERKRGFSFCGQIAQRKGKSIEKRALCVYFDTYENRIFVPTRRGDQPSRRGDQPSRRGNQPSRRGDPPSRRGKAIVKKREGDRQEEAAPSTRRG